MPLNTPQRQSGFAMMEVLVTALIVAIGISGVGVLLMRSVQGTQDNSQRSQAMWIVQDFVGRLRANSTAAKSGDYEKTVTSLNCSAPPAVQCTGNQACSAGDMATYDSWISVCGFDPQTFDSPADFVVNPTLSSSCTLIDSRNDCVQYTVNLEWDTKLATESETAAERINRNNYTMVVEIN